MTITLKQNTQIQLERQGKKKNHNPWFRTYKSNKKKKNTNLNPQIYPIKKQREKNIAHLKHEPQ
jgi:hypothetical protein